MYPNKLTRKTMDPNTKNNMPASSTDPMRLEVVKSCVVSPWLAIQRFVAYWYPSTRSIRAKGLLPLVGWKAGTRFSSQSWSVAIAITCSPSTVIWKPLKITLITQGWCYCWSTSYPVFLIFPLPCRRGTLGTRLDAWFVFVIDNGTKQWKSASEKCFCGALIC